MRYSEIIRSTKPDINSIPGGWEADTKILLKIPTVRKVSAPFSHTLLIEGGLADSDCNQLIDLMNQSPNFEPVSIQGRKDIVDDRIGSVRTTIWSPLLAEQLRHNFLSIIPDLVCDAYTPTDWWQGDKKRNHWMFEGVTPMFRFMRYGKDGQHYAHYDAGFIYPDDNYRSLLSFVIYLTTNNDGCTRIIGDNQNKVPVWDRDHDDWTRKALEEEVVYKSRPVKGNIFVFPHRVCHDVEQFTGDCRMIIRGDILFKAKQ